VSQNHGLFLFKCHSLYLKHFHRFVKEKLVPSVYSEEQFIFLCHLVAPFLSRYNLDKPSPSIVDITVELFNALERMDKHVQTLRYMDPICDLLYPFLKIFNLSFFSSNTLKVNLKILSFLNKLI